MRIFCFFTLLFSSLYCHFSSYAQLHTDSAGKENMVLNEAMLIKDQQQKQIDSLVRIQLEKQLTAASGNLAKTRALEGRLREISVNDSLRNIAQAREIKKLKADAKGYPVRLNQDTLFMLFTRTGSFNAKQRAEAVSGKISGLYHDPFYAQDSIRIQNNADSYDIIYKDRDIILTVSNLDGLWFGKTNQQISREYLSIIKSSVADQRKSHSLGNWAKRIGLAAAILVMLIFMIRLMNMLFGRTQNYLVGRASKFHEGISFRTIRIIAAKDLEKVFIKANNFLKIIVIIFIVYLSLPLLFSIFPETEAWTGTLLQWILGPIKVALNGVVNYLPNLFTVLVIYLIFKYSLSAVRYFFYEIQRSNIQIRGFHADWAIPTFNIIRFVLYAFMLVIIFPYLPGSGSAAFQGVSVFLGILISLGSSSAITNIVAGLVITYMRPFKIGDRVKIGEVTGDITEKTMLVTRILTIKNEEVTVPNSMVLSSSTVNYSRQADNLGLIIHYEVTLGYEIPWSRAYGLLISAAKKTLFIESAPEPFVLQTKLNDFYVSYQINAYTKSPNKQAVIYSNLLENVQNELGDAGIELLSPYYNVIRKE